jgi:hypothetical protein
VTGIRYKEIQRVLTIFQGLAGVTSLQGLSLALKQLSEVILTIFSGTVSRMPIEDGEQPVLALIIEFVIDQKLYQKQNL